MWLFVALPFTSLAASHLSGHSNSRTPGSLRVAVNVGVVASPLDRVPVKSLINTRVSSAAVWGYHTLLINSLSAVTANYVTFFYLLSVLLLRSRSLMKHILPFSSREERLSPLCMEVLCANVESVLQLYVMRPQLIDLSSPVAQHLSHSADIIILSEPPASFLPLLWTTLRISQLSTHESYFIESCFFL